MRVIAFFLAVMLLLTGCAAAFAPQDFALSHWMRDMPAQADGFVMSLLAGSDNLQKLAPAILLWAGAKEQDGIFITADYLLDNVQPRDSGVWKQNVAALEDYLEQRSQPAVLMLIPTACAIKQQEVPALAPLFNQRAFIDSVYNGLAGRVTAVDVYSELFTAKDQYIYYRTASNLTGMGGFYVYRSLATRLGFSPRTLDQFDIEHLTGDYYGDLYARSSFKGVEPDIVTIYSFTRFDRQYRLTHWDESLTKSYYTLFPRHLEALGRPLDVILGGFSPRIDVTVSSPYEESFLIVADESVMSYLPFLLVHFGNVTVIDLMRVTDEQLATLDLDNYDQIMFAYSVDNFLNQPVAAGATRLIKE